MVQVMLGVNNELGLTTGRIGSLEIYSEKGEQLIYLEVAVGNEPSYKQLEKKGDFKIGRNMFMAYDYRPCAGNIFWDSVMVTSRTAAELLNFLKLSKKWDWHGACPPYDLIWDSPNRDFKEEDFKQ